MPEIVELEKNAAGCQQTFWSFRSKDRFFKLSIHKKNPFNELINPLYYSACTNCQNQEVSGLPKLIYLEVLVINFFHSLSEIQPQ